jgi:tetratricopeptide (TPR) repeat protein
MTKSAHVNLLFGGILVLLGATALGSMYANRNRPAILEAASSLPASATLPEGHLPPDAANKVAILEQMSRSEPKNPDLKAQLGNAYYDQAQYRQAAEAYQESLDLRPQDPNVETDMGTCFHYLGETDKALEVFERVLSYKPDFAQALLNKGIVLLEGKKDARGAIDAWEELLRAHPDFPQRAEVGKRIRQLKGTAVHKGHGR